MDAKSVLMAKERQLMRQKVRRCDAEIWAAQLYCVLSMLEEIK